MSSPNQSKKSDSDTPDENTNADNQPQSGIAGALAEHAAASGSATTPTTYRSGYMTSALQNNPGGGDGGDNDAHLNDSDQNIDMNQERQVEVQFDSPVRRNLQAALTSDADLVTSADTTPTPTAFLGSSPDDAALAMAAGVLYGGTNAAAAAAAAAMAASVNVSASGPFGSPEAFLSGENIDLPTFNSGQQPTPAHSLATSPYNPYEDDASDAITPITNNKIRLGSGGLGVGELSHGIQVPLHALNMPIIDEQGSVSMDSPPAESVVSAKLTSDGLSPPVLDSASVTSKSFVEDDISRNSGSIGGGGGGNGGIPPRRGQVLSWDHARAAGNSDMFMTGLQQPQLDDVPEESSFGGGAPAFRGGGDGVPPVALGGPPPHPLAAGGNGGMGRNTPNRPPRAPPLPPQPRSHGHHVGTVQFSHRRGASLGDHSILSVLTEPSLEEGDIGTGPPTSTSGGSRRKISWDFDSTSPRLTSPRGGVGHGRVVGGGAGGAVPMSILQPVLSEGNLQGLDNTDSENESTKEGKSGDVSGNDIGEEQKKTTEERFVSTRQAFLEISPVSPEAGGDVNNLSPQLLSPPEHREVNLSHSAETFAVSNTAQPAKGKVSELDTPGDDFQGVSLRPPIEQGCTKIITIADIAANPHEEEAETSILKAIERRESEQKERSKRSITGSSKKMAGMDDAEAEQAAAAFAENAAGRGTTNENKNIEPQASTRNTTKSGGNKMVDLTEQLMMMQQMNVSIRSKGRVDAEDSEIPNVPEEHALPVSSFAHYGVEALVQDGAKLFRRNKSKTKNSQSTNAEASSSADTPTAKSRWGKVQGAVVAGAVNKEKVDGDSAGGGDIENQTSGRNQGEASTTTDAPDTDNGNGAKTFREKGKRELHEIGLAFKEEVHPRKQLIMQRAKCLLFGLILPSLLVASVLFYALKNPLVCTPKEENDACASWSWWIIFILIRQPITLFAARVFEIFIVDIFSLRTRISLRIWGPFITLWIVQSKGWPSLITLWAIIDFIVLYGKSEWTNHWLFWQQVGTYIYIC